MTTATATTNMMPTVTITTAMETAATVIDERAKSHWCVTNVAKQIIMHPKQKGMRAHGVVVSHPLRMRKALGSNPSVSILIASQYKTFIKINDCNRAWNAPLLPNCTFHNCARSARGAICVWTCSAIHSLCVSQQEHNFV